MALASFLPPPTDVDTVTEILHGVEVVDPYRWLEDQDSSSTRRWIKVQTNYARAYFASLPEREIVRQRVDELLSMPPTGEPWKAGERYFFLKRQEGREQPDIVMRDGLFGEDALLVEAPEAENHTLCALSIAAVSQDGHLLAYTVRQRGTDHSRLDILDVQKRVLLPEGLSDGFCTGLAFALDGTGFYYCQRALRDPRPHRRGVFWHCFGNDGSQDVELFFAGEGANLFVGILDLLESHRLMYVVFSAGKAPATSIYLHNLDSEAAPKLLLKEIE